LVWTAGVEGLWSPIHGKIGLFTSKLFHFDVHLAVGVGAIGTDVFTKESGGASTSQIDVAANAGAGVRMYFLDWLAIRFEYRHFFFAAAKTPEGGGGLSYPLELSLGASFFL
jgi:outer membrane beta-barrel protein